jgi:hypothetical protein
MVYRLVCIESPPTYRSGRDFQGRVPLRATTLMQSSAQTTQQVIDNCGMLAEYGVTDAWVNPPPLHDFNAYLDHMQWAAEEVIPNGIADP